MAHRPVQHVNVTGGFPMTSGAGTFSGVVDEMLGALYNRHAGTGNNQVGIWKVRMRLPSYYRAWDSIVGYVRRNGATDALTATLLKNGVADSTINALDIRPDDDVTWTPLLMVPGSAYSAGDFLTLEISSTCDNAESHDIRNMMYRMSTFGGRRVLGQRAIHAVLGATAGNGTWSSEYDTAGRFVSRKHAGTGANQAGQTYLLQRVFTGWVGWQPLTIETLRSGSTTSLTATLLVNGAVDPAVNGVPIYPGAADTWEPFTISPSPVVTDDLLMLKIVSTVANGGVIRLRDYDLRYSA